MKNIDVKMCLLTISVQNSLPKVVKLAKNSGFHRKYILNLQKPYRYEFAGGWGLLVFHKYFLVSFIIVQVWLKTKFESATVSLDIFNEIV